eukprot:31175-Pelagococcus_subviridis.AAC.11
MSLEDVLFLPLKSSGALHATVSATDRPPAATADVIVFERFFASDIPKSQIRTELSAARSTFPAFMSPCTMSTSRMCRYAIPVAVSVASRALSRASRTLSGSYRYSSSAPPGHSSMTMYPNFAAHDHRFVPHELRRVRRDSVRISLEHRLDGDFFTGVPRQVHGSVPARAEDVIAVEVDLGGVDLRGEVAETRELLLRHVIFDVVHASFELGDETVREPHAPALEQHSAKRGLVPDREDHAYDDRDRYTQPADDVEYYTHSTAATAAASSASSAAFIASSGWIRRRRRVRRRGGIARRVRTRRVVARGVRRSHGTTRARVRDDVLIRGANRRVALGLASRRVIAGGVRRARGTLNATAAVIHPEIRRAKVPVAERVPPGRVVSRVVLEAARARGAHVRHDVLIRSAERRDARVRRVRPRHRVPARAVRLPRRARGADVRRYVLVHRARARRVGAGRGVSRGVRGAARARGADVRSDVLIHGAGRDVAGRVATGRVVPGGVGRPCRARDARVGLDAFVRGALARRVHARRVVPRGVR